MHRLPNGLRVLDLAIAVIPVSLLLPRYVAGRPAPEFLRWHNDNVFERSAA